MTAAANIRSYGRDVRRFADDQPAAGAQLLEAAIESQLRADTGGDGGFSRGRDMGRATIDVDAGRGSADVSAAGSMAVWAILERGTRGHETHARAGGVLATPYGPRRSVRVSGVGPRRTWTRANDQAMPRIVADTERRFAQLGG